MNYRLAVIAALLLAFAACAADENPVTQGITVPKDFEVVEVFSGLSGLTQINIGPDGTLLVAQLNGGENDEAGQILVINLEENSTEVLYGGLDKPTGVALLGDEVYVMERNRLSVGSLDADPLEVIVEELPTNGRSEGTLTTTPDQTLLFNTSGSIRYGEVVEGSGQLWELRPGEAPEVFAKGFKNAYAHHVDASGQVWMAEISDGSFDGAPAEDEVVIVSAGDDGGWPFCVGDQVPVEEFGGDQQTCAQTVESFAVFEPGATPTSVVVAPWDNRQLLVALWNEGCVVTIDIDGQRPVPAKAMLEGLEHPQHLLAIGESVLVTDPDAGRILLVSQSS